MLRMCSCRRIMWSDRMHSILGSHMALKSCIRLLMASAEAVEVSGWKDLQTLAAMEII
jgi:hypothetical protein